MAMEIYCQIIKKEIPGEQCKSRNDKKCLKCRQLSTDAYPRFFYLPGGRRLPFPLYKEREGADMETMVSLNIIKKEEFLKTQNPFIVIEAFVEAQERGVSPPNWALNYVTSVFRKYYYSPRRDIDKIDFLFGTSRGPGQDRPYTALLSEQRDYTLCLDVFKLRVLFGFSIEDAAAMVARRFEESKKSKDGVRKIGQKTIQNKYAKYAKTFEEDSFEKALKDWSPEEKEAFLNLFPKDSLPLSYSRKRQ
jgi:hypothetical protein